jgi:hypothetical protein
MPSRFDELPWDREERLEREFERNEERADYERKRDPEPEPECLCSDCDAVHTDPAPCDDGKYRCLRCRFEHETMRRLAEGEL